MFNIRVRFLGGLSASQQAIFEQAAARWSQAITGDLPRVRVDGEVIDDLLIEASGTRIDGELGILGQAAPTHFRSGSLLPAKGFMEFDRADLRRMQNDGSLLAVIIHEMGHVLGIGTLWRAKGLLEGSGSADPVFVGANAMREFGALIGASAPTPVPVENRGGPGTREGHWRDLVFGNELMTGFVNRGINPLSRFSIASLQDLGYQVNLDAAEPYNLPSSLQMAMMGLFGTDHPQCCCAAGARRRGVEPIILPESATVKNAS